MASKDVVLKHSLKYLESFLDFHFETIGIPGMVVAVALKGELLFCKALGFSSVEKKMPMRESSLFRIASHSKMFTASAVAILIEQGRVKFNDPVSLHLPWLRSAVDRRLREITVSQLLSHTAGIVRDGWDGDFWNLLAEFPDEEQLKTDLLNHRLLESPGKRMKYSNYGYGLLGMIVEAVSGERYKVFLEEEVLGPLSLKDTGVDISNPSDSRFVTGYLRKEGTMLPIPVDSVGTGALAPATGFYSTVSDLHKFLWSLCPANKSNSLLQGSTRRALFQPQSQIEGVPAMQWYGRGFIVEKLGRRTLIGHSGGFTGQNSTSLVDSKEGIVVSVLTNSIVRTAFPAVRGIFQLFDFFRRNTRPEISGRSTRKFIGRYSNLSSTVDFIPFGGGRVCALYPAAGWTSFSSSFEMLRVRSANELRAQETGSFGNFGEPVHFQRDKRGRITSVEYGPYSMRPRKEYLQWLGKQKRISIRANKQK